MRICLIFTRYNEQVPGKEKAMLQLNLFRCAILALAAISLSGAVAAQPQQVSGTIAYVGPSRESTQIRLIEPDSSDDRLVWQTPNGASGENGVGTLSWRPDASEIAFDSSHDALRSLLTRDIYGVQPAGTGLRRITAPPGPLNTASLPKATVTLRVENYAFGKELSVYVDGAPDAVSFVAPADTAWNITFTNVVDFGPNVRQYARVLNTSNDIVNQQCWFDVAVFVDVEAGQTQNAGTLSSFNDTNCPYAFRPDWSADGAALNYFLRDASTEVNRTNDIWQTSANAAPTTLGAAVLDMGQFVARDKLYLLARGPTGARQNQLLYAENGATFTPIYLGAVDNLVNPTLVEVSDCGRTSCKVLGLEWLPDGSGFVFSRIESGPSLTNPPPAGSAIYVYNFATAQTSEVLRLPGEVIGRLTVAPDGQTIAFERAPNFDNAASTVTLGPAALCPCSIWTVRRNDSELRQLVADGRAPAWSSTTPTAAPKLEPRLWLPLVRRPG
jgi:hypothetical protein